MPELPEIEVARRDLDREAGGRKIKAVDVVGKGVLIHHKSRAELTKRLTGCKIKSIDRRGFWILAKLDSDDIWAITPGPTGRFYRQKAGKLPRGLPVMMSIKFTQGGSVHVLDEGRTVRTFVVGKAELAETPELAEMGLDPLETPVPWSEFGNLLRGQPKAKLKALLQDQTLVAGLGPVYTDEILFHAGLRYDRTPGTLSAHEVRRLYRSMVETLSAAIKQRGVSLDDNDTDMFGKRGTYGAELQVYQRQNEICSRCRGTIERVRFQRGNHFFCPNCQS